MSATLDIGHFKQRLVDERARVQEALDYLHEEAAGAREDEREEIPSDNHPAPPAHREIYTAREKTGRRARGATDAARERIEEGTSGPCRTCSQEIAIERLE